MHMGNFKNVQIFLFQWIILHFISTEGELAALQLQDQRNMLSDQMGFLGCEFDNQEILSESLLCFHSGVFKEENSNGKRNIQVNSWGLRARADLLGTKSDI